MAMTATQAKQASVVIPGCCVFAALALCLDPFINRFQQQSGEAEANKQMTAIALDSLANRCLTFTRPQTGTLKRGAIVPGQTPQSLTTSCLYLNGSWGFLAVKDGHVQVMQVYSDKQINAVKSNLNPIQGN